MVDAITYPKKSKNLKDLYVPTKYNFLDYVIYNGICFIKGKMK